MIIGVFLRNIKTYRRIHYIPLSTGENFCGLVGANGVGKSSILEAIDCLFNEREWNLNIVTKRSGKSSTNPYIVPVFLLPKTLFRKRNGFAETLSQQVWSISSEKVNPTFKIPYEKFEGHRNKISKIYSPEEYLLLPVGLDNMKKATTGIFDSDIVSRINEVALKEAKDHQKDLSKADNEYLADSIELTEDTQSIDDYDLVNSTDSDNLELDIDNEEDDERSSRSSSKDLKSLFDDLRQLIEYIYIPKEIDPELFTKLETKEIQVLMGETLRDNLDRIITKDTIDAINQSLKDFIDGLSKDLVEYSYRTLTSRRQQNLKKSAVHNLVIEAFFGIRKLHKMEGEDWLSIGDLSSGEKHKAIIDVAYNLLHRHRGSGKHLIIAIDEPESSLHISACFDQISSLFEISQKTMQLFFATHWYGFFPVIDRGSVNVISRNGQDHVFDLISLGSYREEIKKLTRESRGKLPHDIRLKSINDLVQSIIASIIDEKSYNWIICEGTSDKKYLEKYFEDINKVKKLKIIPVGGVNEIKKIYGHLMASYEEFKSEAKGKVILISDTDSQLVEFSTSATKHIICKRIVNMKEEAGYRTLLVDIQSNPKSPPTVIEDALNGKLFYETLKSFIVEYPNLLDFVDKNGVCDEAPTYFSLDLRPSEREKLEEFLSIDNNKFRFAEEYANRISCEYLVPDWIQELKKILLS